MSTFGGQLRVWRTLHGLTQRQLGDLLGCGSPQSTISQWERGVTEPYLGHFIRISERLDVSLDWLIAGRGKGPTIDPNTQLHRTIQGEKH